MSHTAAITIKSKRKKNDRYFTPASAVECLLKYVAITGKCLEPCAGEGAIVNVLVNHGLDTIHTDISTDSSCDATTTSYWGDMPDVDWVVTNPPFNYASQILPLAFESARVGIAFLLRLSYLEPCENRGEWLAAHPPSKLIIMPRISFSGDNRVDSCTTAWCIFEKNSSEQKIIIVPKS